MTMVSRRGFIGGIGGCLCCGGSLQAAAPALDLAPLLDPGFRPADKDEKGLWQSLDRAERDIADSPLRVHDPALETYVGGVMGKLAPDYSGDIRCYIVRVPALNATMAPNGMLLVYSGALLRLRHEAGLATILGHECGHYLRRHQIASWRQTRGTTAWMAFLTIGLAIATGVVGGNNRREINAINNALALSIFRYRREQEAEADVYGVRLMAAAGYPPGAAADFWRDVIAEHDAATRMRGGRTGTPSLLLASHPSDSARLAALAKIVAKLGPQGDLGRAPWRQAMATHQLTFLDDQVKLNDPGASLTIIDRLAEDGWTGPLRYQQGEVHRLRGANDLAFVAFAAAVALPDAPALAHRAYGYGLLRKGQGEAGTAELRTYLAKAPDADDRAMVEFTLNQ